MLDGDTPAAQRDWARSHANYLLTTPDMLHQTLLPRHARWTGFYRRLRYIVVDECHTYRGVFGSHVAQVLRRLHRVAVHHIETSAVPASTGPASTGPVFLLASATVSDPAGCARLLTGRPAEAVTENAAPRGPVTFALWEPPLTRPRGEADAPVRRSATAEAATLLADLVAEQVPVLAFTRSRRGAEGVALAARRALREAGAAAGERAGRGLPVRLPARGPPGAGGGAAQRGHHRAGHHHRAGTGRGHHRPGRGADRRLAGYPGRAVAAGGPGRAGPGRPAVVVLIARDDPLDTYLVHHPEALLHRPVEATVLDPGNPYVLAPHLCAAAAELPLTQADLGTFGPGGGEIADALTRRGMLRRRGGALYWTSRGRPRQTGLRGTGTRPVKIVELPTGRLIGTVDEPSAHLLVHAGAVYLHQGETYLVEELDLAAGVALAGPPTRGTPPRPGRSPRSRSPARCTVRIGSDAAVHFGDVQVRRQVTGYVRRGTRTNRLLGQFPLSLPPQTLRTRAVWWTISAERRRTCWTRGWTCRGPRTRPSTPRSGCCRCSRRATGGTSAACPPTSTRRPAS